MNKKGMINITPLIAAYLGFIVTLILPHYLTFNFPFSIRLINKPLSLPEEIMLGIMIAPIILLILLLPVAYIIEKHVKLMAQKHTENMQISIIKITEPSTWSKVYHCHIKSDKIDTDCKIICYKDSQIIKSVIFPKDWRKKNQELYKYYYYISDIIGNEVKKCILSQS
ncbi:hypothetical protein [Thermoanaerobacterium sp. RBIITD]|uniref:hypothetical protein n=1 Tax=Thermoanaerobacterium sp. RBIITD TaxID=1550240 RepID=UPI000BB9B7BE|nr:hypothetical protein [Thermoanaerobacterium sp. RBIITD]SNX54150.1 hypothetical protein SAMN05660242_1783 [Thermoanaerobacterium sp. RBIITD]